MNIKLTEVQDIKRILGREYDLVREFYYHVCTSDYEYKVLLTRRSYVLFKIFEYVFNHFPEERVPFEQSKHETFKLNGKFLNTHSIYQIPYIGEDLSNKKILIIDDIIINGRTISNICKYLTEECNITIQNIKIWSIYCNDSAKCISDLQSRFGHVRYVPSDYWKSLSNKLAEVIICLNVGYVSFVESYKTTSSLENIFSDETLNIERNTNIYFEQMGITSKILFCDFSNNLNNYKVRPCVRFYKKGNEITVVPYVFLPSLKSEQVFNYCASLLAQFEICVPSALMKQSKYRDIILYQWTVYTLSKILLKDMCAKFLLNEEDFNVCMSSAESYIFSTETDNSQNNLGCETPICVIDDVVTQEMAFCKNVLKSKLEIQKDFNEALALYLYDMRENDERKALQGEQRYEGIRVSDIINVAKESNENLSTESILAEILSSLDSGKASYIITQVENNDTKIITGVIRQGEQGYKLLYELYSHVYNVFYEFFCRTFENRNEKLLEFAEYLNRKYYLKDFVEFAKNIDSKQFTSDVMAIAPDKFFKNSVVKNPELVVADYIANYYRP